VARPAQRYYASVFQRTYDMLEPLPLCSYEDIPTTLLSVKGR
jgi:hypothetical protein